MEKQWLKRMLSTYLLKQNKTKTTLKNVKDKLAMKNIEAPGNMEISPVILMKVITRKNFKKKHKSNECSKKRKEKRFKERITG